MMGKAKNKVKEDIMVIDMQSFSRGENGIVQLDVGRLPSNIKITVDAHVFRSKKAGPSTLILAGIHGDEVNGIEIVRRFLSTDVIGSLQKGSLIVIPLLNIYGFNNAEREVPGGRDVNRSFPGTKIGSLASRIARVLTKNILPNVNYMFDFHTGGDSRYNFPQVRYTKSDEDSAKLAKVFCAPYTVESGVIPKSLRKITKDMKIPSLIYEGGESIRINRNSILIGYEGLMRCLGHLGHLKIPKNLQTTSNTIVIKKTTWVRASNAGIFLWTIKSGNKVSKGDKLGTINDINGKISVTVVAPKDGYIIGHNNASVVNHGDALFHIGYETIST